MHFWHVLFYEYKKGNKAASAFKNISATYGEGSLSEHTCRKWFTRFREENFNLCDESRLHRPLTVMNLRSSIEKYMTKYFGTSRGFGTLKFKEDGNVKSLRCFGTAYTEKHLLIRVTSFVSLLPRHKELSYLNRFVTEDEKWISCNNVVRKKACHCQVNPVKLSRRLDFTKRRSYYAFGRIV